MTNQDDKLNDEKINEEILIQHGINVSDFRQAGVITLPTNMIEKMLNKARQQGYENGKNYKKRIYKDGLENAKRSD